MPRRTKVLLTIAAALALFLPIWRWGISPRVFPTVACVIEQPDGAIVKAWGEAACIDNGMPTIVLRANQPGGQSDERIPFNYHESRLHAD